MIYVLRLICDLQAGAPHPEMHRVHVDLAWKGLIFAGFLHIRIFVLEKWHFNFNLLFAATLVDGLGQTEETRVGAGRFFGDKFLMRMDISAFNATLIRSLDVCLNFLICRSHRPWGAQNRTCRSRNKFYITAIRQKIVKIFSPRKI